MTNPLETKLARDAGIEVPILCGAMYPCSNPELIAAVSEAGAMGIVQPLSLIHVHGHDLREGLRLIRGMTTRPIGFNAIVEKSVKAYEQRMRAWVAIALEEGVRFFVTALGNPDWVVEAVHEAGGLVYHDVTERRWAEKALASGVDGLICVNGRAGGHAGTQTPEDLYADLCELGVPLV
ncbi:MAG: nitronate monooxygenase, partial [Planctomycetota bacterium]|nr:nitronate monooxygenase [Planctomycetota bacterium]